MKIIFLDIDGVICTSPCYGKGTNNKWGSYMFDPKCVSVLNFILSETGADIILSSDWKNHYTLFEMKEIFTHNGVIKSPIGFTPNSKTYTGMNLEGGRIDEIKMWLKLHDSKNHLKWVVVDDLNMSVDYSIKLGHIDGGLINFVHCPKHMEGIKQCGVKEKILKFLE